MTRRPHSSFRAFTLIELLVVIAIIAVVAGLVVGLAGVVGEKKKISRALVERDKLVLLIESYKSKVGVYPPQNPNPNKLEKNSLLYELAGAFRSTTLAPSSPDYYATPLGSISSNLLYSEFGMRGVINAIDQPPAGDTMDLKRALKSVKPDQVGSLAPNTLSLVVPIDGPNGQPNAWKYLVGTNNAGTNVVHNPNSFDIWVEIAARNKIITIGNWKD